jgi:hypothetical protein
MDPYLEAHWGDVHGSLVVYARDLLQGSLPSNLRARIEERVVLEALEGRERLFVPDVRVIERRPGKGKGRAPANGLTAEPLVIQIAEEVTQRYIEIRDLRSGGRVVTAIEILSPSNKVAGDGQDKYLQKRQELREGKVSLVDIDLLRAGKRLLPIPLGDLPAPYRTPYLVWVRRGWKVSEVEVYRVPLTERLPTIRVPLRQTDADVPLDLQALIEQCYRNGGYEDDMDYGADADPPLQGEDARWADALLREAGLRGRRSRRRQP